MQESGIHIGKRYPLRIHRGENKLKFAHVNFKFLPESVRTSNLHAKLHFDSVAVPMKGPQRTLNNKKHKGTVEATMEKPEGSNKGQVVNLCGVVDATVTNTDGHLDEHSEHILCFDPGIRIDKSTGKKVDATVASPTFHMLPISLSLSQMRHDRGISNAFEGSLLEAKEMNQAAQLRQKRHLVYGVRRGTTSNSRHDLSVPISRSSLPLQHKDDKE